MRCSCASYLLPDPGVLCAARRAELYSQSRKGRPRGCSDAGSPLTSDFPRTPLRLASDSPLDCAVTPLPTAGRARAGHDRLQEEEAGQAEARHAHREEAGAAGARGRRRGLCCDSAAARPAGGPALHPSLLAWSRAVSVAPCTGAQLDDCVCGAAGTLHLRCVWCRHAAVTLQLLLSECIGSWEAPSQCDETQ